MKALPPREVCVQSEIIWLSVVAGPCHPPLPLPRVCFARRPHPASRPHHSAHPPPPPSSSRPRPFTCFSQFLPDGQSSAAGLGQFYPVSACFGLCYSQFQCVSAFLRVFQSVSARLCLVHSGSVFFFSVYQSISVFQFTFAGLSVSACFCLLPSSRPVLNIRHLS